MNMNIEQYHQPTTDQFSAEQDAQLKERLDSSLIRHRRGAGNNMYAYITAKTAIDAANRIFGFGRWGYRVINRERQSSVDAKGTTEFYTADIELYVLGNPFPFPGDGVGIVTNPYTVEMHEKARKEAVSDALKRALRHYGDQFGLALYDGDAIVETPEGEEVSVKDVAVNTGNNKQKPRRVVDAGQPAAKPTNAPVVLSVDVQVKRLKQRAKQMGVATNTQEWSALLARVKVSEMTTPADVAKVSGYLTQVEKSVQSA